MTKLPETREEYAALTDEERAEVVAQARALLAEADERTRAFARQIAVWYTSLPLIIQEEMARCAREDLEERARDADGR